MKIFQGPTWKPSWSGRWRRFLREGNFYKLDHYRILFHLIIIFHLNHMTPSIIMWSSWLSSPSTIYQQCQLRWTLGPELQGKVKSRFVISRRYRKMWYTCKRYKYNTHANAIHFFWTDRKLFAQMTMIIMVTMMIIWWSLDHTGGSADHRGERSVATWRNSPRGRRHLEVITSFVITSTMVIIMFRNLEVIMLRMNWK